MPRLVFFDLQSDLLIRFSVSFNYERTHRYEFSLNIKRHFGLRFSGSFSAFFWLLVTVFLVPVLAYMQHYLPACSLGLGLNNRLCAYLLLGRYAVFNCRIQMLLFFLLNKSIKASCKLYVPAMTGFPIRSFISHLFTEAVLPLSHIHMV